MMRIGIPLVALGMATGCGGTGTGASLLLPTTDAYAYPNPSVGNGEIFVVPPGAGTPTVLVAAQGNDYIGDPRSFAFDGTTVYYGDEMASSTLLLAMPVTGGTAKTLVSLSASEVVTAVAVDATNIYYVTGNVTGAESTGTIGAAPLTGGAPETLVGAPSFMPVGLAAASGYLYWTDVNGDVLRIATTGGDVETVATNQGRPESIAADPSGVYWVDGGQLSIDCGSSGGRVVALPTGSTEPMTLASGLDNVGAIAVATGSVYYAFDGPLPCDVFTGSKGQIELATSGISLLLATGLEWPSNLFVTSQAVYYTTEDSNSDLAPHDIVQGDL